MVSDLDREAAERGKTIGKWQVTGTPDAVASLWPDLVADAEDGVIWAAKAMTPAGYAELSTYDDYLIAVYTPNYLERHDVDRVREHLRRVHGVNGPIRYKPDLYTAKGIVDETTGEFGLERAARYVG